MRTGVVVTIAVVRGGVFVAQKHYQQNKAPAPAPVTAQRTSPTARPVSEHNWAKHALDTTSKVTRQVAKQRKEEDVRK